MEPYKMHECMQPSTIIMCMLSIIHIIYHKYANLSILHCFTIIRFVRNGSSVVHSLALGHVQLFGCCGDTSVPLQEDATATPSNKENPTPSRAAGLPHFSTGGMRCWGRDTFISLRGLMLVTGQHKQARWSSLNMFMLYNLSITTRSLAIACNYNVYSKPSPLFVCNLDNLNKENKCPSIEYAMHCLLIGVIWVKKYHITQNFNGNFDDFLNQACQLKAGTRLVSWNCFCPRSRYMCVPTPKAVNYILVILNLYNQLKKFVVFRNVAKLSMHRRGLYNEARCDRNQPYKAMLVL